MSLLSWLRGGAYHPMYGMSPAGEARNSYAPSGEAHYDFSRGDVVYGSAWQDANQSGVSVTQETALQLPAVYRCVTLNSETPASLPVETFTKTQTGRKLRDNPFWLEKPNPYQTWMEFLQQVQASLELDGNAFILKAVTESGVLVAMYVLPPSMVTVERSNHGSIMSRLVYRVGGGEPIASPAILHLRGFTLPGAVRGMSPITAVAMQTIGTGKAAETFAARFFGEGAHLSGTIETAGTMTKEAADRLKADFRKRHGGITNSHAIGILTGGAKWNPISVPPNESQFIEAQRWSATQIASVYGIPPAYVTDAEGAKGFVTAVLAMNEMWLQTGLLMRIRRLEVGFSSLLPKPAYIRFNLDGFLRADPTQRVAYYAAGQQGEWLMRNDIRKLEDMDPIEGGDEPLHSVQWQENKPDPVPPPEPPPAAEPVVVNNHMTMPSVDARTTIQRGAMQVDAPVTVNAPPVTVNTPDVTIEPAEVRIDAPVTVNLPKPAAKRNTKFVTDKSGRIVGKTETEE